ncbi:MAG TPA: hypothetical protein VFC93_15575 [Chloroflexota bacterium]|nr:hypothetical protein [Chloroflexota bacterium]
MQQPVSIAKTQVPERGTRRLTTSVNAPEDVDRGDGQHQRCQPNWLPNRDAGEATADLADEQPPKSRANLPERLILRELVEGHAEQV